MLEKSDENPILYKEFTESSKFSSKFKQFK